MSNTFQDCCREVAEMYREQLESAWNTRTEPSEEEVRNVFREHFNFFTPNQEDEAHFEGLFVAAVRELFEKFDRLPKKTGFVENIISLREKYGEKIAKYLNEQEEKGIGVSRPIDHIAQDKITFCRLQKCGTTRNKF